MNKNERMASSSHLLRSFLAIAECQSITQAAELMGRTQSAISVQVKTLEEILNVSLFTRQSKGMILTPEGEKLLPAAHKIVSDLMQVGQMFDNPLEGRIRVGIPDDYAESVLENVLVKFATHHPGVEVSARFGCTSQFPKAIKNNKLDIAVASDPTVKKEYRLTSANNAWLASPSLTISAMDTIPLAILDRNCSWRTFASDALSAKGRKWRIAYASENFSGIKSAVRSGLAVAALPRLLKDPDMIELGEENGFPTLEPTIRGILVSSKAPEKLLQAMVSAIKHATQHST